MDHKQVKSMSSTYLSLHYHLVFGVKDRMPLITMEWHSRLHEYLGGTVRGLGGFAEGMGGVADHVHLLVSLKATHCLANFLRELKKASSAWVHETAKNKKFGWQVRLCSFYGECPGQKDRAALHCESIGTSPQKIISGRIGRVIRQGRS
jgi:REP element-mobilizing transposase RayT